MVLDVDKDSFSSVNSRKSFFNFTWHSFAAQSRFKLLFRKTRSHTMGLHGRNLPSETKGDSFLQRGVFELDAGVHRDRIVFLRGRCCWERSCVLFLRNDLPIERGFRDILHGRDQGEDVCRHSKGVRHLWRQRTMIAFDHEKYIDRYFCGSIAESTDSSINLSSYDNGEMNVKCRCVDRRNFVSKFWKINVARLERICTYVETSNN